MRAHAEGRVHRPAACSVCTERETDFTMKVGRSSMLNRSEDVSPTRDVIGAREQSRADVFADISHELGNFFHRLYYCSELVRTPDEARASEPEVGEMLSRTIGGLEGYLDRAFEYLCPVDLAPVRMTASDLLVGLASHLRAALPGTPVEVVALSGAGPVSVVDPARFSTVAQVIAHRVAARGLDGGTVAVVVDAGERPDIVALAVSVRATRSAPVERPVALPKLDWALAELIVNQHGGELRMGADHSDPAVTLQLPVADFVDRM